MAYPLFTSEDPPCVRFGNGLAVRRAGDGWEVGAGEQWRELTEPEYWRAVALLEHPLGEVRSAFAQIDGQDFPLLRVINSGLSTSRTWAELALKWVAEVSQESRQELEPALRQLEGRSWATQQMRHAARKAIRRPRAQRQG